MKRLSEVLLLSVVTSVFLVSCSSFDFSKVEVFDVRVGPNGDFAVAYYSNETVNVYSFEKLVKSFERKAVFVSTSSKTYGGYFLVKDFGFLHDGRIYIVAYKPTLGWMVRIGDKEIGYYSYVQEFKFSDDVSLIGFVYNVGGDFLSNCVVGGKYYVNINGQDMGPYDYVGNLIFSKSGKSFAFSYSNDRKWYVRISDYDYVCYNQVILPAEFGTSEDIKFVYRIKKDWFLYPDVPMSRNIYKVVYTGNHTFFVFTNYSQSFVSNNFTNFSVEGTILDIRLDGEDIMLLVYQDGRQKILFRDKTVTFDSIAKYQLVSKKVVYKAKDKEEYYVGIGDKIFGPYNFADFHVEGNVVRIGYIKNGRFSMISEKL